MKIRRAQSADAISVVALYQSLVGTPGCPWHADYPTLEMPNQILVVVRSTLSKMKLVRF